MRPQTWYVNDGRVFFCPALQQGEITACSGGADKTQRGGQATTN